MWLQEADSLLQHESQNTDWNALLHGPHWGQHINTTHKTTKQGELLPLMDSLTKYSEQLAGVFTSPTFSTSRWPTIEPESKQPAAAALNSFHPDWSFPPENMLAPTVDSYKFTYKPNRAAKDAISSALRSALTHMNESITYVRMLPSIL